MLNFDNCHGASAEIPDCNMKVSVCVWVISLFRIGVTVFVLLWRGVRRTLYDPEMPVFLVTSDIEGDSKCEETLCDAY